MYELGKQQGLNVEYQANNERHQPSHSLLRKGANFVL